MRSDEFSRFQLDPLEARVLLSASLDPGLAVGAPDQHGVGMDQDTVLVSGLSPSVSDSEHGSETESWFGNLGADAIAIPPVDPSENSLENPAPAPLNGEQFYGQPASDSATPNDILVPGILGETLSPVQATEQTASTRSTPREEISGVNAAAVATLESRDVGGSLDEIIAAGLLPNAPPSDPMSHGDASASSHSNPTRSVGLHSPPPAVQTVSGVISANTTWSGTVQVTGNLNLPAGITITIQPGTVVKFNGGLLFTVSGTIDARGSSSQPITFTASSDDSVGVDVSGAGESTPAAGDWEAINFEAGSGGSVLENVVLRYAGMTAPRNNGFVDAILIRGGSSPTLRDVAVRNVAWTAVRIQNGQAALTRVDVQGAGNVPFHFDLAADPVLTSITGSNNKTEGLWYTGGSLPGNRTWAVTSMPYLTTTNLVVPGAVTLTLGPGVVLKIDPGSYLSVSGTLNVNGTADAPVVITSHKDDSAGGDTGHDGSEGNLAPKAGDWEAIYLEGGSGASVLSFLEVRYAGMTAPGNNSFVDAIMIRGGSSPTLRDVKVRNVAWTGVRIVNGDATVTRVDVQGAGNVPFHFDLAANPVLTSITASNNKIEGLWITGGSLPADRTWAVTTMPYVTTGNIVVPANTTLTLGPGVVVKVDPGSYLDTFGTLLVQGTLDAPVVITSRNDDSVGGDVFHDGSETTKAPTPGDWESLYFEAGSSASVLSFLEVRYSGMTAPRNNSFVDAITIRGGSSPTLRDVKVRNVASTGVRIANGDATLTRVDVQGAGNVPFHFDLAANPMLTAITASNNKIEGLWITAGSLPADRTWAVTTMPYVTTGNIVVPADRALTLGPGVVVKVDPGSYLDTFGTLLVQGTLDAPVVITSRNDDSVGGDVFHDGSETTKAPAPGDWESLYFEGGSSASVLSFLEVRYAGMTAPGNNSFVDAITIRGGSSPTLRDLRIRDVAEHGVRITSGQAKLERVDVQRAGGVPYYFDLIADPVLTAITASNNKTEGLWLNTGQLTANRTWAVTSMAYNLTGDLRIGADTTLEIGPGVVVKMNPGAWIAINGTLLVNGTLEAPVVITSRKDDSVGGDTAHDGQKGAAAPDPGDWESLYFENASSNSVLNFLDVRYAGETAPNNNSASNAIDIASGQSPKLTNVRVLDSYSHGIWAHGDSKPTFQDVRVERAGGWVLVLDLASVPVIQGLSGFGNLNNGIHIFGGALPSNRVWDYGALPIFINSDLRIPAGSEEEPRKLTIAPGTVVKMNDGAWIAVNSNLQAVGTADRPIIFTSFRDDSVGGDTNGDGSATTGQPGLWESIYLEPSSSASVLSHVEVRHTGMTAPNNNSASNAIDIAPGQNPTLANVRILDTFSHGIWAHGDSKPTIQNVRVERAGGWVLVLDLASVPVVQGLSGFGNLNNAIHIFGGVLPSDRVWDYGPLPIFINSDFRISGGTAEEPRKLTIAPGTVVKMTDGAWIAVNGNLQAVGTVDRPIIFTGFRDDSVGGDTNGDGNATSGQPGLWESFYVENGSAGSLLEHVEVRYAGMTAPSNNSRTPSISVSGSTASITLRNSRIVRSFDAGITVEGGGTVTVIGSLFSNLGGAALAVNNGTATVSSTAFASVPAGVSIQRNGSAKVNGSSFTDIAGNAAQTANTDFAVADFTGNWWGDGGGPNDASPVDARVNVNPAGEPVSDFIDYSGFLTTAPALPIAGPFVRGATPSLSSGGLSGIDVTFSASSGMKR